MKNKSMARRVEGKKGKSKLVFTSGIAILIREINPAWYIVRSFNGVAFKTFFGTSETVTVGLAKRGTDPSGG